MGKALYRKYRSRSLSEIIGQEHITSALESAIKNQTPSHAYLFIGPRGTGKTSVARILAHAVNGFEYQLEDEHLDIIEIDAASNTGVDNIRELREKSIIAPSYGKYKVYIIDEVHMLSKSAFNALLKTLEEPPAHVIFIMATTDAHKVPITITSRSQVFTFKLADTETMQKHLRFIADQEKINIDDEALKIIARRGGGSFRDSISLLDQISTLSSEQITAKAVNSALGLPSDALIEQILAAYSAADLGSITKILKDLQNQGSKAENIAENLIANIIAQPKPEQLTLLDQLTEVPRANFPAVKLLLALSSKLTPPTSPSLASPTVQHVQTQTITPAQAQPETATRIKATAEPEPEKPADIPKAPDVALSPDAPDFWNKLLENIKQNKPLIHGNLEQCEYRITQQKLTLFAAKPFYKMQLDKNKGLILQNLPSNFELEIISGAKPSSDPTISAIADIMGGGEEVSI